MSNIIGILNLTPDSFSDGGAYADAHAVHAAAVKMLTDGAELIDIGAESTRPGAVPISPKEEWARLAPSLELLGRDALFAGKISIDTRHAEVAERALDAGAAIINDVSGGADEALIKAVAVRSAGYMFMHSLSVPADPLITLPSSVDVVETLKHFAENKKALCLDMGISPEKLIFDPGIGFSKTTEQSLDLLARVDEFKALGLPLAIGHSRKSFLKAFTNAAPKDRDTLTLTVSAFLALKGVDYLRVHNVPAHFEMLKLWGRLSA